MDLQAYLDRIGFTGVARPDLATLKAMHRGHALSISYENLDVQLGRSLTPDPAQAFDKIVGRGRGGWCYEMNGVLGAALDAVGFKVTRLAGGVMRSLRGDAAVGNHLVLLIDLDGEPWIGDVGFGDGPRDPYPLRAGPIACDGYEYQLEQMDGGWWRLHNHPAGGAPNFDFTTEPADPALLAAQCQWLQTAPESPFVMTAVAQRHAEGEIRMLRGRAFRRITPTATTDLLLDTADEFIAVLKREFDLDVPEAAEVWPRVVARHDELFAPQPA